MIFFYLGFIRKEEVAENGGKLESKYGDKGLREGAGDSKVFRG